MAPEPGADPSALLTTALEKLLYLESRLDTAEASRDEARREGERHRLSAQAARQALSDWQRRATDAEVSAEGAEREVQVLRGTLAETRQALNASPREAELAAALRSAEARLGRFEEERTAWLGRMVKLQQLGGAAGEDLDLGAFISELRAENLALQRGDKTRVRLTLGDLRATPDPLALMAEAPVGRIDPEELLQHARLPRADRTLASLCGRDLLSDSAAIRRRAAERLLEGRIQVLGPFIGSLLGTEPDPGVRVAFVRLLALGDEERALLPLQRALHDNDTRVRAAALEALARRPDADISPLLHDPSPAVRRRALTLLPKTKSASVELLGQGLCDDDASVRKVAVLSLASHPGREVVALLGSAARSADQEVRDVATRALERRGLPIPSFPPPLPAEPMAPPPPPKPIVVAAPAPVAVVPIKPAKAQKVAIPPDLEERMLAEIQSALRGRTEEELAESFGVDSSVIAASAARLVNARMLIRRGRKLYQA